MKLTQNLRGAAAGLLFVVASMSVVGCIGPEGRIDVPATVVKLEAGQKQAEAVLDATLSEVADLREAVVAARVQLELTQTASVAERERWATLLKDQRDRIADAPEDERPALENELANLETEMRSSLAAGPGLQRELLAGARKLEAALQAAQDKESQARMVLATTSEQLKTLKARGPEANFGDLLAAAGQTATVIAPATGPAAPWVAIIGAAAAGLGGILGSLGVKRPGDISPAKARELEHAAWDEAQREAMAGMQTRMQAAATSPS